MGPVGGAAMRAGVRGSARADRNLRRMMRLGRSLALPSVVEVEEQKRPVPSDRSLDLEIVHAFTKETGSRRVD